MAKKAPVHPTTAYALDVVAGTIVAGKWVRSACDRHLRDLKLAGDRGLYFDTAAANHGLRFYGFLRHSKGKWARDKKPFELLSWQQFVLGSIYGWKRADGTRRFRSAYLELCKKNGKSTLAAGVALYALVADNEPGAEVYSAATKRDQAKIVFGEGKRMVKASPLLRRRLRVLVNAIEFPRENGVFAPLGADADTMFGVNVHTAVIDELHRHKTREAFDVIDASTGAREQPLLFIITTAGSDTATICWEQHDYAQKVLEGVLVDDELFAYIAAIDEGDDWADPKNWIKGNPSLDHLDTLLADLKRKCRKAKSSPASQNVFRRLHCGEWTEAAGRAIEVKRWKQAGTNFDPASLEGRDCWGGLDLSSKIDLSAFALVFPPLADSKIWRVLVWHFMPRENIAERIKTDRVPYDRWMADEFIIGAGTEVIDQDVIKATINEQGARFAVQGIGYDSWNAAKLGTELEKDGFDMVEVRQGAKSMGGATKAFRDLVHGRRLDHGNNPVLTWEASNLVFVEDRNENFLPDKAKSTKRIDGIVATIIGIGRADAAKPKRRSLSERIKRHAQAAAA